MAPLKNNVELADIFNTDTNGVLPADKKGVIVYTNDLLRSYFRLSEDAGIGLSVGDLIPNTEGDAAACIRTGKAINGRRLKKRRLVSLPTSLRTSGNERLSKLQSV